MDLEKAFKYDVAFSFHSADEGRAVELNDLLSDRFSTFLYSEHQKELAGTDGEVTFNAAFGVESRVVVVLYRDEWGGTPFTRIEMTAIKNRAFNSGYDFTLFIPTTTMARTPPWLPKSFIYYDLERFGVVGAAAVVTQKITTAGGISRPEGAADRAVRFARSAKLADAQRNFLGENGVKAARDAFDGLSSKIASLVDEINGSQSAISLRWRELARYRVLGSGPVNAVISWEQRYGNSIDGAELQVTYYLGLPSGIIPGTYSIDEAKKLGRSKYVFKLVALDRTAYVSTDGLAHELAPDQLADHLVREYLDVVERRRS